MRCFIARAISSLRAPGATLDLDRHAFVDSDPQLDRLGRLAALEPFDNSSGLAEVRHGADVASNCAGHLTQDRGELFVTAPTIVAVVKAARRQV